MLKNAAWWFAIEVSSIEEKILASVDAWILKYLIKKK